MMVVDVDAGAAVGDEGDEEEEGEEEEEKVD